MEWLRRLLLLAAIACPAFAARTTVEDTLQKSDGTFCTGTITISWVTFYNASTVLIQGGTITTPVATNGTFAVQLEPTNQTSTPPQGFYTAQYNLRPNQCASQTETWSVPISAQPVNLINVRTVQIPPPPQIPITSLAPPPNGVTSALCFNGFIQWGQCGGGGGGGVSSVGLALPNIFSVSGSPITSSGTLTGTLVPQASHLIFGGPVSGSSATPTFRALAMNDIPSSFPNSVTNDTNVTGSISSYVLSLGWSGLLGVIRGGTGAATLSGLLKGNGTSPIGSAAFGDVTTLWSGCSGGTGQYLSAAGSCQTAGGATSVINDTNVTGSITGAVLTLGWQNVLAVSRGGIGAGTLSGIAKGNGTSAFTPAVAGDVIGLFSGCSGILYLGADGACHSPAGAGTVTSVGLTLPSFITVTGSPITTSGTFAGTLAVQNSNSGFFGPTSGSPASPTFRAMVGADLPNPSATTLGGIESITPVSHNFLTSISTLGVPVQGQPAFSDLSGSVTCAQLPGLTGDTTTSAGFCGTTTSKINSVLFPTSATVIGANASAQPIAASLQGTGSKVQLSTGSTVNGDCAEYDINGNVVDSGSPCGSGGTVSSIATTSPIGGGPITTTGTITCTTCAVASGSLTSGLILTGNSGNQVTVGNTTYQLNAIPSGFVQSFVNDTSTGTTANKLVKVNGASQVVRVGTGDTDNVIGVCVSGCTTSGGSLIGFSGTYGCIFDNGVTAGDWVQISSGTAGDCHDSGSATRPTSGQVLGHVLNTNASAGTYNVQMNLTAPTGGTGTVTSVALALPSSILTVSGSPVTGAGTLTGSLATQTANTVWAGPASGSPSTPTFRVLGATDLPTNSQIRTIGAAFDGAGSALTTTNAKVYYTVPFACTIAAWNITVDTGTITFDIWKIATGTAIPTITNTITASALPAISTGTAIHSTSMSGWTTSVSANDIFAFVINTVATATKASITLQCSAN